MNASMNRVPCAKIQSNYPFSSNHSFSCVLNYFMKFRLVIWKKIHIHIEKFCPGNSPVITTCSSSWWLLFLRGQSLSWQRRQRYKGSINKPSQRISFSDIFPVFSFCICLKIRWVSCIWFKILFCNQLSPPLHTGFVATPWYERTQCKKRGSQGILLP